jgi:hypothetical protein
VLKDSEQINRQHGTRPTCQQPLEQAAGIKALSSKYVEANLTPETFRSLEQSEKQRAQEHQHNRNQAHMKSDPDRGMSPTR